MIYEIRPIAEDHIASFRETLDVVARERKFLSFLEAPPLEQMRHFVLNNIKEGYPIELTVRETNVNAIALYRNFGFETEGMHRNAVRIEGRYENTLSMALVAQQ